MSVCSHSIVLVFNKTNALSVMSNTFPIGVEIILILGKWWGSDCCAVLVWCVVCC